MKNIWKSKAASQRAFISEKQVIREQGKVTGVTSLALVMGHTANMAGWGKRGEFLVTDQGTKDLILMKRTFSSLLVY